MGDPRIDPRFDPRFQRGFEGVDAVEAPQNSRAGESRQSASAREAARGPAREREHAREPVSTGEPERTVMAVPTAEQEREPNDNWIRSEEYASPPPRNPFRLAILIASLAMLLVGGWLIWSELTAGVNAWGDYDSSQRAVLLLQQQLSPALLIGGVFGVISWLVLGAFAALERRERR